MRKWSLLSVLILAFGVTACSDDDDKDCVDNDGDGYGVGADCLGADCDDDDANVWESMSLYPDADGDGTYADAAETICTDGTVPAGYSETAGDDCDDSDENVYQLLPGYVDADDDGYGDATEMEVCSGADLPAGYVDNGDDCDDASDMAYVVVQAYADLDEDGLADATNLTDICTDSDSTLPAGWSLTAGTDCDDYDPYANLIGGPACTLKGACGDTEMGFPTPMPDMMGVGACVSVDCNGMMPGQDPASWMPMFPIMVGPNQMTCTDHADCGSGNICLFGACWAPNGNCNTGTLTCSEIPDCMADCRAANPTDLAAYVGCAQFTCIEGATPVAQHLYAGAQSCAAAAGCWALGDAEAITSCVSQNCLFDENGDPAEFALCMGNVPTP